FSSLAPRHPIAALFPYTTLFRSDREADVLCNQHHARRERAPRAIEGRVVEVRGPVADEADRARSQLPADLDEGQSEDMLGQERRDRKSTRLNSSHRTISYAVFCL